MVGQLTFDYSGKTAIITGSTKGIGRGIAETFVKEGANVLINSRSEDAVDDTVEELAQNATGDIVGIAADVAQQDGMESIVDVALGEFDRIDVLVNNAAVWPREESMVDATIEDWDHTFAVNVRSQFYLSKLVAEHMIESGTEGSIINLTSQAGDRHGDGYGIYGVSKSAINGLIWRMAYDLAPEGIRVNGISTAQTETHQLHIGAAEEAAQRGNVSKDDVLEEWAEAVPMGRLGTPTDLANAVLFLASDRAKYLTGNILRVSGGGNLR